MQNPFGQSPFEWSRKNDIGTVEKEMQSQYKFFSEKYLHNPVNINAGY